MAKLPRSLGLGLKLDSRRLAETAEVVVRWHRQPVLHSKLSAMASAVRGNGAYTVPDVGELDPCKADGAAHVVTRG